MIPTDPHSHGARQRIFDDLTVDEHVDVEYRPMPPKASFPMSVEIIVRGRGKPLPFPLDVDVPD